MQAVTREILINKAAELLGNGTVDRVFGWKKGEFSYDVTPALFTTREAMDADFVFGDFCGANFSKYLVAETRKEGKVLVFLKPCDTYSFNQLLTEHRFDREKVYVVGIPCSGMLDTVKIKAVAEGIASVEDNGDRVTVHSLFDGDVTVSRNDMLPDRCKNCKSKKHVAYDELIGEDGEVIDSGRFDEVEKLEKMTPDERFAFWQNELSRCIRCNACRDVCPACTCEKCVFDNPDSGVENKAAANSFEEKMFHIIRAFHVAGRCTDCGECSRVCPQHIPLHLLNRKFIKDINEFYGDYQAGAEVGSRAPLVNYTADDPEPAEAVERSHHDA
ncbi:MAG: 4Fe-4S dicluster domain-containing protein [Clostridia bacterium]|nr:4Fe-4S dicluster domain-containing protein [Clostridia bacterium]